MAKQTTPTSTGQQLTLRQLGLERNYRRQVYFRETQQALSNLSLDDLLKELKKLKPEKWYKRDTASYCTHFNAEYGHLDVSLNSHLGFREANLDVTLDQITERYNSPAITKMYKKFSVNKKYRRRNE